jgi:hypothetical protein
MFEYYRFTDRAHKVMKLANQEAIRLNHEYLGTEHILLGLAKEGHGVAAVALRNLGADYRRIRIATDGLVRPGPDMVTMGKLPQTPRAKAVIEYSMEEAKNLNHKYVGTEHLLLGLLREQAGVAINVLMSLSLAQEAVRMETLNLIGFPGMKAPTPTDTATGPTGAELIATERRRQIEEEEWDGEHDDQHADGELAAAAVCYAARARTCEVTGNLEGGSLMLADPWPWDAEWDKRSKVRGTRRDMSPNGKLIPGRVKARIRDLVKAGALIAAEIDRLQRLQEKAAGGDR